MIIHNDYNKSIDCVKDAIVNGEHLTLTVSHRLADDEFTGWFASITTHDPETDETDWGFCYGWCASYPEVIAGLKSNRSYKEYPFPV